MKIDEEILFVTFDGLLNLKWSQIVGWLIVNKHETEMVPHKDPKLALKGQKMESGRARVVQHVQVICEGRQQPIQLSPVQSAEFLLFLESIKVKSWRCETEGVPEIIEFDASNPPDTTKLD